MSEQAGGPIEPPEEESRDGANIAVIVFIIVLVVGGIWLFNSLTAANDTLNCVASGRRNCHEIAIPDTAK
jgi:hypothetical protein